MCRDCEILKQAIVRMAAGGLSAEDMDRMLKEVEATCDDTPDSELSDEVIDEIQATRNGKVTRGICHICKTEHPTIEKAVNCCAGASSATGVD